MAMNRDGGRLQSIQNSVPQPKNPVSTQTNHKTSSPDTLPTSSKFDLEQKKAINFQPFGISASEKNGRLIVEQVRPRSAAASAKIRSGDEILTIAQKRTANLSSVEIRQIIEQEPVLIEWLPTRKQYNFARIFQQFAHVAQ